MKKLVVGRYYRHLQQDKVCVFRYLGYKANDHDDPNTAEIKQVVNGPTLRDYEGLCIPRNLVPLSDEETVLLRLSGA